MNLSNIKKEFPIFNNKNLVYLDSANSSQKPQSVIDRINDFYSNCLLYTSDAADE